MRKGKSSLDSFKVVKEGRQNYLEVKVKAGWPTKQTEVSYRMGNWLADALVWSL